MALSHMLEKLGRAVFEAPFGGNKIAENAPEIAEIRLAILDAVKAKSHRAGGKNVFAYNLVRVHLLGIPAQESAIFQTGFLAQYFTEELKSALARSHQRFPDDLHVHIETAPELPQKGQQWIRVEVDLQTDAQSEGLADSPLKTKLVAINTTAVPPELPLTKTRTNIGRTVDVFRSSGPSRRNDLAFSEDNEINRTVSREHAHILYSQKSNQFRLFNDRTYKGDNNCGLWIVRDGLSQPVHRGARGVLLEPGDEIHLGSAVLQLQSRED